MGIEAKIILDSISPQGARLTTFECRFPRFILAEVNTHRALSRNTASSRAIPAAKFRDLVITDPVIPVHFGANQKGMQADSEVQDIEKARAWWLRCMQQAVALHQEGESLGIHKQIVNRVLEPYMYVTAVITATDYANFFTLRTHRDAQPEFQALAKLMYAEYKASKPSLVEAPECHMPYIRPEDWADAALLSKKILEPQAHEYGLPINEDANTRLILKMVSVARCARTSYLTHDGKRDLELDVQLHDKLFSMDDSTPGHWSPFEHVASPLLNSREKSGNFTGWRQHRKVYPQENTTTFPNL